MTWFKVDDSLYDHPKVETLSLAAVGLWCLAGTYCARQLTDGFISVHRARVLGGSDELFAELLLAGLWDETDDGFQFHDWTTYQPTREHVEAKRKSTKERVAKWRKSHGNDVTHIKSNAVTNADVTRPVTQGVTPPPTRPDPTRISTKNTSSSADANDAVFDAFNEFWTNYPRKVGKASARKAFAKAVLRCDPNIIITAAAALADDPNLPETKFIPHPATWLNRDGWDDEPYPERVGRRKSASSVFMDLARELEAAQ